MSSKYSFWNEDVWLPSNVTWDLFSGDGRFAQFSHLYYPIPAALAVIAIRMIIERHIFRPLGLFLGLKHSVTNSFSPVLEEKVQDNNSDDKNKNIGTKKSWAKKKRKKLSTLGRCLIFACLFLKDIHR